MKIINLHVCVIFKCSGSFQNLKKNKKFYDIRYQYFTNMKTFISKKCKTRKENTFVFSIMGKKIRKKTTRMVITPKTLKYDLRHMIYVTSFQHLNNTLWLNHLKKEWVHGKFKCYRF